MKEDPGKPRGLKRPYDPDAGSLLIVCSGILGIFYYAALWALFSGPSDPNRYMTLEEKEGTKAEERALALETLGQTEEALLEYRLAASIHPHEHHTWQIEELLRKLGRYDEASRVLEERNVQEGQFSQFVLLKAHCLAEGYGVGAALAYLKEREDYWGQLLELAQFHSDRGEWCEALPELEAAWERTMIATGYEFSQGGELLTDVTSWPKGRIEGASITVRLARASLGCCDPKAALRYAMMAISITREKREFDRSWAGDAVIDGGGCEARLIRARAFMDLAQLESAREELLHAARSGTSSPGWLEEIERLKAQLDLSR